MKPSPLSLAQPPANALPSPVARANAKAQEKAAVTFASRVDTEAPSHVPTAQAARAALEGRSDLSSRPFGAIVSMLARHLELPAAPTPATTEPPVVEETPAAEEPIAVEATDA